MTNNAETNTSGAPTAPVAPEQQPVEQQQPSLEEQLADLRAQIAEEKVKSAELSQRLGLSEAVATSRRRAEPAPSLGQIEAARGRAIGAIGNSKWHQLPVEQRLAAIGLGERAVTGDELAEAEKFFGPRSEGAAAQGLHQRNPLKYQRLKAVYRETHRR